MFTQLATPMPVHVLDKGDGFAMAVIDYGQEHDLIWVTAITATGELWCAPNPRVRMQRNWTAGRPENPLVTQSKRNAAARTACTECANHALA